MKISKRDEILQATIALLGREGFDGFSAGLVAREVGISKSTLFHHFSSIDNLIIESLKVFSQQMAFMQPPVGISLNEWLNEIGEAFIDPHSDSGNTVRAYFSFVAKAMFKPNLQDQMAEIIEAASEQVTEIILTLTKDVLDRKQATELGDLIFITIDGASIHIQLAPHRAPQIKAAWQVFVSGICHIPQENRS